MLWSLVYSTWTEPTWVLSTCLPVTMNRSSRIVVCKRQLVCCRCSCWKACAVKPLLAEVDTRLNGYHLSGPVSTQCQIYNMDKWILCVVDVHTIRDAILTCARKPTWACLIYRTETTTKKCKTEKVQTDMLRSNSMVNHVVSPEEEKKRLRWAGFAEKEGFKPVVKGWVGDEVPVLPIGLLTRVWLYSKLQFVCYEQAFTVIYW